MNAYKYFEILLLCSFFSFGDRKQELQFITPSLQTNLGVFLSDSPAFQFDCLIGPLLWLEPVQASKDPLSGMWVYRSVANDAILLLTPQLGYTRIVSSVDSLSYNLFLAGGKFGISKDRDVLFTFRGNYLLGTNDNSDLVMGGLGTVGLGFKDGVWGIETSAQGIDGMFSVSITAYFDVLLITVGQLLGAAM